MIEELVITYVYEFQSTWICLGLEVPGLLRPSADDR
jgi:hypothetical protein